ncbi:ACP S-malonyltransferase [Agrobacterium vitis]|uniref:ACP S-malonyltransferase n=1 Tax=Agrobacterium vitis TaxID=373 RepID=UPI003D27E329
MTQKNSIVFCFAGQGSQYFHMGRALFDQEPVFRASLEKSDDLLKTITGVSVLATLFDARIGKTEVFDDVLLTNPAIVMLELALVDLLADRGIRPDKVMGTSLGEFAAAVAASVLSADECLRMVSSIAGLISAELEGGMLAILANRSLYEQESVLHSATEIAGVSSANHFIVSGRNDSLREATRFLLARNIPHQMVPVRHAFHSRLMDSFETEFRNKFKGFTFAKAAIPFFSCATQGPVASPDAAHLWNALRMPIQFSATVTALEQQGPHVYLDLGPSGGLHNHLKANFASGSHSTSLPLLSPFSQDTRLFREAVTSAQRLGLIRPTPVAQKETSMKVYGFPGQGSQEKGMQGDLFKRFPQHVARADTILGYSIDELCRLDPDDRLKLTEFTQPALYVVESLSYLAKQQDGGPPPAFLAGHSIGEYAALFAAECFDFETGLELVRQRAQFMSAETEGGMAAVIGLRLEAVKAILSESGFDALDIAGHNKAEQVVLSGPIDVLNRARPVFEARQAGFMMLNVSAAAHSRYMRRAADHFRSLLNTVEFKTPRFPVIANTTGRPHRQEDIRDALTEQIVATVQWVETVRYLMAHGDFSFEELGPGTVLTRTVDSIRRHMTPLELTPDQLYSAPKPEVVVSEPKILAGSAVAEPLPASHDIVPVAMEAVPDGASFGSESFRRRYGLQQACLAGGLYGGISGQDMLVRLASHGGMLGFFGSGGLDVDAVESQLQAIGAELGAMKGFGANLTFEALPERENKLVNLYLRLGIETIEVSGFLKISPALAKFRCKGGKIIAKVSSLETAQIFLQPPSPDLLRQLVETGDISEMEKRAYERAPVATDLCVEGEGGWLWSGASLLTLLPAVIDLRDAMADGHERVHIGAAGGLGTPASVKAAVALGAEFILLGSVTQCTVEAATSATAKDLLAKMSINDVEIAPFGPLFDYGMRARMLKRGVFFPARASRLLGLWRDYEAMQDVPPATRQSVEKTILRKTFDEAVQHSKTRPGQTAIASLSPKAQMAAVFSDYISESFFLAQRAQPDRVVDYAIYTGSALGAFNQTVQGTPLEHWSARHVDRVMKHLLNV